MVTHADKNKSSFECDKQALSTRPVLDLRSLEDSALNDLEADFNRQRSFLKSRIQELEKELCVLRKNIVSEKVFSSSLNEEIRESKEQLLLLNEDCRRYKKKASKYESLYYQELKRPITSPDYEIVNNRIYALKKQMEDLQRENEWCMKKNQQLSLRMSECTEEHASLTVEKESLEKRLKQMTFNYKASVGFAEEHEDNISKLELQIHSLSRDLLKANAKITTYIKEEELQAARIEEFYKENQELKVKLTALENGSVKKSSFEVLLLKYNDLQNEMDCLCCERDVLVLVYWVEWAAHEFTWRCLYLMQTFYIYYRQRNKLRCLERKHEQLEESGLRDRQESAAANLQLNEMNRISRDLKNHLEESQHLNGRLQKTNQSLLNDIEDLQMELRSLKSLLVAQNEKLSALTQLKESSDDDFESEDSETLSPSIENLD